jgi:hypothetical protein
MYHYKIILCTKDHSHDWGACPYAHEKENARRRDPSKFKYSSCICPNAKKPEGCPNGVACPYAHTLFEYWLHPQRFRTQMCRSGAKCQRSLCFFAHSAAELRSPGSTHEQNIPLPLPAAGSVSAPPPAPAGNLLGLSAVQVQQFIDEPVQSIIPLNTAVEQSGSSYGSQASRMLLPPVLGNTSGSVSSNASDTEWVGLSSPVMLSSPIMVLPAQQQQPQQQQVLPSAALLLRLQQQQELQRRQARFMELQLQLKQQQESMHTALLQAELQQQQLAALSHPLQVCGGGAGLNGLTGGPDMTLSGSLLPSLPSNMMPSAVNAASSAGVTPCMLPASQLASLSSSQSMLTVASPLAGLSSLSLSDGHYVSVPSAAGLDCSNIMCLASEPVLMGHLDVAHGNHVQSWL